MLLYYGNGHCLIIADCHSALPGTWTEYPNAHVYDGVSNSASDLTSCQEACINNGSCTRLDWSPSASSGRRCWLHGSWSSSQQRRSASEIMHYVLSRSSVGSWVMYSNMHVYSGVASSAADIQTCKKVCLQNASCTRFDWSATASVGERCWTHGPWSSSESRRTYQGVQHYELHRGSDGLCGK